MKKNSCTPINRKKYSCYGLKKIHRRNLITKNIPGAQKFAWNSKISPECSLNQPKAMCVCIRSINQSNRFISVRLLFPVLFARLHFKVIQKSLYLCIYIFFQEMIEMIKESVVLILHTHDGARVGMHCLWHGTTKVRFRICCVFDIIAGISWLKCAYFFVFQDRKVLIKSFKGYYVKICKVR